MNCVICKQGRTRPGQATITLERGGTILVVKEVPAELCENCGEPYVAGPITTQLLRQAEEALRTGVQFEVRDYVAA